MVANIGSKCVLLSRLLLTNRYRRNRPIAFTVCEDSAEKPLSYIKAFINILEAVIPYQNNELKSL